MTVSVSKDQQHILFRLRQNLQPGDVAATHRNNETLQAGAMCL